MKESDIGHGKSIDRQGMIDKIYEVVKPTHFAFISTDGGSSGQDVEYVMVGDVLDYSKQQEYLQEDTNKCPKCGELSIRYDSGDRDCCQKPYFYCNMCDFDTEYDSKPEEWFVIDNTYKVFTTREPENIKTKSWGFYHPYKGSMYEWITEISEYEGKPTIFDLFSDLRKPIELQSDRCIKYIYDLVSE